MTSDYYLKNKQKILLRNKEWQKKNKEKTRFAQKEWRLKNRERYLEVMRIAGKRWRANNKDKVKANRYKTRDKLRKDVLNAYGHECICCKEKRHQFLAIDHINGGGNKHRKSLHKNASAQTFYTWLRKNNYPVGFQVLCHNCNCAKAYYKICPHQIKN
jgi:hypothetical protein